MSYGALSVKFCPVLVVRLVGHGGPVAETVEAGARVVKALAKEVDVVHALVAEVLVALDEVVVGSGVRAPGRQVLQGTWLPLQPGAGDGLV